MVPLGASGSWLVPRTFPAGVTGVTIADSTDIVVIVVTGERGSGGAILLL
jgi:hypothetical protein